MYLKIIEDANRFNDMGESAGQYLETTVIPVKGKVVCFNVPKGFVPKEFEGDTKYPSNCVGGVKIFNLLEGDLKEIIFIADYQSGFLVDDNGKTIEMWNRHKFSTYTT